MEAARTLNIVRDDSPAQTLNAGAMRLLPPKPGACRLCAVKHTAIEPHNAQSLYYQYRFRLAHGRWPTWADAVAHCDARIAQLWRKELEHKGRWSAPAEDDPVAEPYERQP